VIKGYISGMLMLCASVPALAQTATFADPSTGVSFQYPKEWKLVDSNQFYLQTAIPQHAEVRGGIVWKAGDAQKTTVSGVQFLYAFEKGDSSEACLHFQDEGDSAKSVVETVKIGNNLYAHRRSTGAGMCHQEREDIYGTYVNHACYLFDLSVHTICGGVVDGMRDATESEFAEARARLVDILKTVQFGPAGALTTHP
jgi:hypothetical protein